MVSFAIYNSSDVKFYTFSSMKSEMFSFFFLFILLFFKLDIGGVQGEWTTWVARLSCWLHNEFPSAIVTGRPLLVDQGEIQ